MNRFIDEFELRAKYMASQAHKKRMGSVLSVALFVVSFSIVQIVCKVKLTELGIIEGIQPAFALLVLIILIYQLRKFDSKSGWIAEIVLLTISVLINRAAMMSTNIQVFSIEAHIAMCVIAAIILTIRGFRYFTKE